VTETRMDRMDRRDGALLRKVGDVIAAEPQRYSQTTWGRETKCGTVACLAGHAALLNANVAGLMGHSMGQVILKNGWLAPTYSLAADALGLADEEEDVLFAGGWLPAGDPATPLHERVRDALYALADGATVEEVSA